jgi:hypothetical protein
VEVIDSLAVARRPRAPSCAVARLVRLLGASTLAALLLGGSARAADPWEAWPEANVFRRLGPTTRLYLVAAYATSGKEAAWRTLDVAGCFDLTLEPIFLPSLRKEDWRAKRYLWARVGYDHVFKVESGELATPEDRGIVALHARAYLPAEILLEGRVRADLRWIGGDDSTRYRLRIEGNREFIVRDRAVTPYFQAEVFYDTRYDGWARQLYQVGTEVQLTEHFRVEPYLARQLDDLPDDTGLYAAGVVARWYY